MKNILLIILLILIGQTILRAQSNSDNLAFTYAEFKAGYGINMFGTGLRKSNRFLT
jgi:hypothetical protein